jgi:multiple sugar transport system substrate-binding protein
MKYLLAGDTEIMYDFFKSLGYSKFSGRKSVDALLAVDPDSKNDVYRKYISENVLPLSVPEPCYPWSFSDNFAIKLQEYMLTATSNVTTALNALQSRLAAYVESEETAGKNPRKVQA